MVREALWHGVGVLQGLGRAFPGFGHGLGAELLGLANWGRREGKARMPGRAGTSGISSSG